MNEDRLNEYVSGRLSSSDRARLERAVEECDLCREELASLRQTRTMLQGLPQEPLPRSFVFAEAPAMAAAEVYRPAEATGFRMPGWAYAGAAAVAGLAVIVFFLSGAVGTWLPRDAENELARGAPTSGLEMAQAESAPAPAAAPTAMQETQPAAPVELAMESAMVAESEASAPALPANSVAPQGAGVVAEVAGEVEASKEVVVERSVEAQAEPAPTAVSEMAALPQAAAMADVPTPTAASVAAQEATMSEPEVEVPGGRETVISPATAGHSEVESATPAVKAQSDALAPAPAASSGEGLPATATPAPLARSGELAEPAVIATVAPATAQDAPRSAEEPPTTRLPGVTAPAITPEPAIVGPTPTLIATRPTAMPTPNIPVPTATAVAIARAEVVSEPTEVPTLKMEPDRAEPDLAAGEVEPGGPVGPSGQAAPAGPAAAEGAREPAGPRGAQGPPPRSVPAEVDGAQGPQGPQGPQGDAGAAGPAGVAGAGSDGTQGPQGPQGPQGDAGAAGPAGVAGTGANGLLRDDSALTVLLGVVAATAVLVVALLIALRIRATRGSGARPGTNYGPDTSTLLNRPKLEN